MALYTALSFIRDKVEVFLNGLNVSTHLDAITKDDTKDEGVYVTLLYFEEEKTLKNNRHFIPQYDDKAQLEGYQKVNPTIFLNLYVMIASNHSAYDEALKQISRVIEEFQKKNVFEKKENNKGDIDGNKYPNLDKLIFEMETLSFDQNNSLWQTIGSKLYPYVIYKVKVIAFAQSTGDSVPKICEEHLVFEVEAHPNTKKENKQKEKPNHEHHLYMQNDDYIFADEKVVKKETGG